MSPSPLFIWPENKSCSVAITVLFDDGLDAVARNTTLEGRKKSCSIWDYGARCGVRRLFDLFEDFSNLTDDECREILKSTSGIIEEVTGQKLRVFCLPQGMWPRHFDKFLMEAGFEWAATLNGDDVRYQHHSKLVQIPVHLELADRPYFQFCFAPAVPKGLGRIASYNGVLHNWVTEFNAYRRYGLCYELHLRPEMIATPGRIFILEQLLQHILHHDDVWLATGSQIGTWTRNQKLSLNPKHPTNVFDNYYKESGCHD